MSPWPRLAIVFGRPSLSPRYLLYCRLFAFAMATHLVLPDALQDDWLVPDAAAWLGALLLFADGCIAGWVLCAAGLAAPLLLLGDQLTQSVYLLGCSLAAIACWLGGAAGRDLRLSRTLPLAVRCQTLLVYSLSALHKLNRDFLDPEVSCASIGARTLGGNWGFDFLASSSLGPVWPVLYLVAEGAVVLLLVVRPAFGIVLALAMHVPLTIVFAPAFAIMMLSGMSAFLTEADVAHLASTMRRRPVAILGLGALLGGGSFVLYLRHHSVVYPFWSFKEALLWLGIVWMLAAILTRRTAPVPVLERFGAWREPATRPHRTIVVVLVAMAVANGLTPYLGLQFHHTGAMLSNLRVDRGCWNSLLFPESLRVVDPYVRIDRVRAGGGQRAFEEGLRSRLWSPLSLAELREASCPSMPRPVLVEGRYRGRRFSIRDLCADEPLPFGRALLPRYRAFQSNLDRTCPQACIH